MVKMNKYKKHFKGLNFANLLPIIIIGTLAISINYLFGKGGVLTSFFSIFSDKDEEKDATNVVKASPKPNESFMTFGLDMAKSYALRLQKAMNPISYMSPIYDGTNEEEIFEVFSKIKNAHDMRAVYREFGAPAYDKGWFINSFNDLRYWLKHDLTSNEYKKIESKIKML